jgi:hypothetical protein
MQPTDASVKKRRTRRDPVKAGEKEMTQIDSTKAQLDTHEAICAERYGHITDRFISIETRFDGIETDIKEIKDSTQSHFDEIKKLIGATESEKFKIMVATAGTVIVGLLGLIGYIVVHLK